MNGISIGGRSYFDPDVLRIIHSTSPPTDPRRHVIDCAASLLKQIEAFGQAPKDKMERLRVLASFRGIRDVVAFPDASAFGDIDAFILESGGDRFVCFNPDRTPGRICFSIAHEIAHTFIPECSEGEAYRNRQGKEAQDAGEIETLCNLAASELLMPFVQFQREAAALGFTLASVPQLAEHFGASFEATVYRLAATHPGSAAAGLLCYRLRKEEERKAKQPNLFGSGALFEGRYRRQAFYPSASLPASHYVPFNKSFDSGSIVYRLSATGISYSFESLPGRYNKIGKLEVISAPYQRNAAEAGRDDLIFLWSACPPAI